MWEDSGKAPSDRSNFLVEFGAVALFCYGVYCVVWPETARQKYLKSFDVGAPTVWYKPRTHLKFRPPLIAVRSFGILLIVMSIGLIYLKYSS
jgi:hypothetical protein